MHASIQPFQIIDRNQVRFQRSLPFTCEQVWPMLTHIKKLASWFLPVTNLEPRLNGRYTVPSDSSFVDGTLTEFDPPHIINFDGKMRFELTPTDTGCNLTLTLARGDRGWIPSTLATFATMLDNLERRLANHPVLERAAYMKAWRLYYPLCEAALSATLANGAPIVHRIHFPEGEDKPSGDTAGQLALTTLLQTLTTNPTLQLAIDGFADEPLDRVKAFKLSQRRAETIKRYLIDNGLAASRITTRAFGNYYRLHPARDEASTHLNRRVELIPLY